MQQKYRDVIVYYNQQLFTGDRADRDATWEQEKALKEGRDPDYDWLKLQAAAIVHTTAEDVQEALNQAYQRSQSGDRPWHVQANISAQDISGEGYRSTCVTDVFCVVGLGNDHTYWAIAPTGFVPINLPQIWSIQAELREFLSERCPYCVTVWINGTRRLVLRFKDQRRAVEWAIDNALSHY